MGYNLIHYTQTFQASDRANGDSEAILRKYPFVVSRQALVAAIQLAADNHQSQADNPLDSQRNPNGYTAAQMADKIIEAWDNIMYYDWNNTTNTMNGTGYGYANPKSLDPGISNGSNWADPGFWSFDGMYFIAYKASGAPTSGIRTAEQVFADTSIILLPSKAYTIDSKEFQNPPFLGLDKRGYIQNDTSNAYTSIQGTSPSGDDFGLTLTTNGSKQVTAITDPASSTHDDVSSSTSGNTLNPQLLTIYEFDMYHDDLNVNGNDFSYNTAYSGADNIETSTKYFDLSTGKFSVTIAGGKVTAITPVARNDGDGTSCSGGFGYHPTNNDYMELSFQVGALPNSKIRPRVLYRTNSSADNGVGNKATVDITATDSEFDPGSGLVQSDCTTAFATGPFGDTNHGFKVDPTVGLISIEDSGFTNRAWPNGSDVNAVDPAVVRVTHERPVLTTETRSLKTTTVGTGAHRLQFEFEYAPMESDIGQRFIRAFEEYRGASQSLNLYIPNVAIDHWEGYVTEKLTQTDQANMWNYRQYIHSGSKGDRQIVVGGHIPGGGGVPKGNYFVTTKNDKIYQVMGNSNAADEYGRMAYSIEPPLIDNYSGHSILSNSKKLSGQNQDGSLDATRGKYFLVKVFLVDDVLDYTVDAAGFYRMSFKFREAI